MNYKLLDENNIMLVIDSYEFLINPKELMELKRFVTDVEFAYCKKFGRTLDEPKCQ